MSEDISLFDPTVHPHRRFNPLTGEHVTVSPHRMKRPWLGQTEEPQESELPHYDEKCYLCPGNARSGGIRNESYPSTMVFENDFPAVLAPPGPQSPKPSHPLLRSEPVQGHCDVLIFHPRHDLTLARLGISDISKIIEEWKTVYLKRGQQEGVKYVQIFENKGAMMGCSNPHPHGQAWSLSEVPQIPATELANLRTYAQAPEESSPLAPKGPCGRRCLLCDYAHLEVSEESRAERVVLQNEDWVAVVPWWAVWPFEVLLLPYKRHVPSLLDLTAEESSNLADILSRVTIRYDNLFRTSFAYSMGIHQQPVPHPAASLSGAPLEAHDESGHQLDEDAIAHLHFHFAPPLLRSATVRKFLVGFELMSEPQRDLTAEQAAQRLRDCPEMHYLEEEN